jgi:hypothetical protein
MNPPFLYKLASGTKIFRATTLSKKGRWYTLSLDDAYTYGENITEYITVNELTLLNVTSLTFHNDFLDRLSVLYPGDDYSGFDINKIKCLIPLGLTDLSSQMKNLNFLGNNSLNINETNWNNQLEYLSDNLLNRHRLSEHSLDANFVSVLEKIYGEHFNGYISPIRWPTKLHGHLFPRELCIFNKIDSFIKEVAEYKRPSVGGNLISKNNIVQCQPFDFSNVDYDAIQAKMSMQIKDILAKPLNLFWNSHTGEIYSSCKPVSGLRSSGGKRSTRRKIRLLNN